MREFLRRGGGGYAADELRKSRDIAIQVDRRDVVSVFREMERASSMLLLACKEGRLDEAKTLLQDGAHVDGHGIHLSLGRPLTCAIRSGHAELAHHLILRGADLDLADDSGGGGGSTASSSSSSPRGLLTSGAEPLDPAGVSSRCRGCGVTDVPLKKCSGCSAVSYCGSG